MTDPSPERPQPQYGQYATAAEQQARIRQPDVSAALDAGAAPVAPDRAPHRSPAASHDVASHASPGRALDRVVTIALLASGLFNVVLTGISLLDFPAVATTSMQMMGIPGEFTNVAQGRLYGAIAAVALVVGWVITAFFAWRRMRAGRLSWWLPILGAAVTFAIVYALLVPALLGDPAFLDYVSRTSS